MTKKDIHKLIEQQEPEAKKRIWEKIKARLNLTPKPKQITLFTYVKTGDGYIKQPITLSELLLRLSDKNNRPQSKR